jgi:hypothetical protein
MARGADARDGGDRRGLVERPTNLAGELGTNEADHHDPGFARELERRFELDVAASVPIDREQWAQRAAGERFKEWLARQWEYLL